MDAKIYISLEEGTGQLMIDGPWKLFLNLVDLLRGPADRLSPEGRDYEVAQGKSDLAEGEEVSCDEG